MIPFGPWEPDKANLDSGVSIKAINVYPQANSFGPMMSFASYGTPALPSSCKGLFFGRTATSGWLIFACEATKIYKLVANAWVDYSRTAGAYSGPPDGDFWSGAQFGTKLILGNANDEPQVLDLDSAAVNFANLGGSPPKARVIRAVGQQVFLCGISTDLHTLKWSGLENAAQWTVDPAGTQADEQTFMTGGRVQSIHGDQTGFLLQEETVRRFTINPNAAFVIEFDEIEGAKGCVGAYSSVSVGQVVYYLARDGFFSIGPAGLQAIGAQRVNQWLLDNCDISRLENIVATADPYNPRIIWSFYSAAGVTDFDRHIIYDWQLDRWSYSDTPMNFVASLATPGTTLDQLGDIDTLPASLDARQWQGEKPSLAGLNSSRVLCFANGPNLAATIETADIQPIPGQRAFINEVRPAIDCEAVTMRLGQRARRLQDDLVYSNALALDELGKFNPRNSAKVYRFEFSIPAGETWRHAQGFEVSAQPDGER